jgi:hypothetical protein
MNLKIEPLTCCLLLSFVQHAISRDWQYTPEGKIKIEIKDFDLILDPHPPHAAESRIGQGIALGGRGNYSPLPMMFTSFNRNVNVEWKFL